MKADYPLIKASLEEDLRLYSDADLSCEVLTPQHAAAVSLRRSFFKKLLPLGTDPNCDARALEKFLSINERSAKWTVPIGDRLFTRFLAVCDEVVSRLPDDFGPHQVYDLLETGPGASREVDSRSLFHKLRGPISASSLGLYKLYRACSWLSDGLARDIEKYRSLSSLRITPENRLFFVPKNAEISRTCCTEPLVNMMFQKALSTWLERLLLDVFNIDLSIQPAKSRELARIGSMTQKFGTIDCTSASDSIPWPLVRLIFRTKRSFLSMMSVARCEKTILPDGSSLTLGMISTMGNGFTFSLQSLIFACAVKAVYSYHGSRCDATSSNFSVFGDDVIVEANRFRDTCHLLNMLNFEVNSQKSFNQGFFRESCGGDFYNGIDIRGVYVRTLETLPDCYSAYNRLVRFSALKKIPLFPTILLLRDLAGKSHRVPFFEDDAAGIKVSFSEAENYTKRAGPYRQIRYRKLIHKVRSVTVFESPPGFDELPFGMSVLHGDFRSSKSGLGNHPFVLTLSPRIVKGSWKGGIGFTPYWDYAPSLTVSEFQEWKLLVDLLSYC